MREIIGKYQHLKNNISLLIDKSGYKNVFIAEKIGLLPNHFSVKKQRNSWTDEEIDKILSVIENEELEDYYLGMLMDKTDKEDTLSLAQLKSNMKAWK
jgi:uncharacterized protein YjcR